MLGIMREYVWWQKRGRARLPKTNWNDRNYALWRVGRQTNQGSCQFDTNSEIKHKQKGVYVSKLIKTCHWNSNYQIN